MTHRHWENSKSITILAISCIVLFGLLWACGLFVKQSIEINKQLHVYKAEQKKVECIAKTLRVAYPKLLTEYQAKYYADIYNDMSKKHKFDEWYLYPSIQYIESKFKPNLVSTASAKGTMQLLDPTAKEQALKLKMDTSSTSMYNEINNIVIGISYLMEDRDTSLTNIISKYHGGPSFEKNSKSNKNTKAMIDDYYEKVQEEYNKLKYIYKGVSND